MTPVDELIDRPAGRPVADHVYGGVPPDALMVRLVAVPTVPVWLPGLVTVGLPPPPPPKMVCEISHSPVPPLESFDQVLCIANEPVLNATFADAALRRGLIHAHLSAFSSPEVSV